MMRQRLLLALSLGMPLGAAMLFLACGAPSSFEHLVGGPEAAAPEVVVPPPVGDSTLKAPRQLAPLAGSFINSLRPHLRWQLDPATIGATIDFCDKTDCSGTKKTFTATGSEFTVPEDLTAGQWFWRLSATTATSFGTIPSATWSLLVRGGPGVGDARGAIVDFNGDGIADLITTTSTPPLPPSSAAFLAPTVIRGNNASDPTSFDLDQNDYEPSLLNASINATYAVVDINGDGLGDLVVGDSLQANGSSPQTNYVTALFGSAKPDELGLASSTFPVLTFPPLDVQPAIQAGGDLDGDGYGDIIVSERTFAFAMYGSPLGATVTTFFDNIDPNPPPDAGELPPPTNPLGIFGLDQNADGIGDILEGSSFTATPVLILAGAKDRTLTDTQITITNTPVIDRALLFAGGDVDADGKPDFGFTTDLAGNASVCVILGSTKIANGTATCFTPATPSSAFGSSIVAADIDGDGKDELLVGSTGGGVDILSFANNALTTEHLAIQWGDHLTVIYPGRPGPAVWAATRSDGASIGIYRAKDQVRFLPPPLGATAFGPGLR